MSIAIEHQQIPRAVAVSRLILNPRRAIQLLLVVAILSLWEAVGRRLGAVFLPAPSIVADAGVEMLQTGELISATLDSLTSLLVGFGAAVIIGVGLGFAMGWYRYLREVLNPFVSAVYVVPVAAIVPLLIIWFGLGFTPRVLTIFLFSVFEILVSTMAGVRNVEESLVTVARSFGASRRQLFGKVVFFAALPYIFAGLRMGAARALKGMIIAELLFAVTGIGGAIMTASNYYNIDKVFVYVIELSILGVVLAGIVQLVERLVTPWKS